MSQKVYIVYGRSIDQPSDVWMIAAYLDEDHAKKHLSTLNTVLSLRSGDSEDIRWSTWFDPVRKAQYYGTNYQYNYIELYLFHHFDQFLEENNI